MKNYKITEGSIWRNMLSFFGAILLGTFFQQFYNTVDAAIVGRAVSSDALGAAGGSAAMVINLFIGFFTGISSGAGVVVAQNFGAGNKENLGKAVQTGMVIAFVGGLIVSVIGFILSPSIIIAMKTPVEQFDAAICYLRLFCLGMVANFVYNMGAAILRAVGDSRRPLFVLLISSVINIVLDVFFIIVLGMGKRGDVPGVAGAAIATVICQYISAVIVIVMLVKSEGSYRLEFRRIKPDRDAAWKIIRLGIPAGLQSTTYTISNILIQSAINELGKDTASAWAAYGKLESVFWMIMTSIGITVTTFVGQNYGAGKKDRVKKCTLDGLIISAVLTIPLSIVIFNFGDFLMRIFVTEEEVVALGVQMSRFFSLFYIAFIGVEILSGTLRGMGDALMPMIITLGGVCVLRVLWILIVFPIHKTLTVVEASYPITWITTTVMYIIYYFYYTRYKKR